MKSFNYCLVITVYHNQRNLFALNSITTWMQIVLLLYNTYFLFIYIYLVA